METKLEELSAALYQTSHPYQRTLSELLEAVMASSAERFADVFYRLYILLEDLEVGARRSR